MPADLSGVATFGTALKEVMEDVKDFTAGAPFEDDITILVIKRNKKESENK